MVNRFVKWFTFTVMFSVLPLIFLLLAKLMLELDITWSDYSTELLFVATIISATAFGDLFELSRKGLTGAVFTFLMSITVLSVLTCCFCYGVCKVAVEADLPLSDNVVSTISVISCILSLIIGIVTQIYLSVIEKNQQELR